MSARLINGARQFAGLAALGLTACLISSENAVMEYLAAFFSFVLLASAVFRVVLAIRNKEKLLFIGIGKHCWFTCGISLILAASFYSRDNLDASWVFLGLAIMGFMLMCINMIKN